MNIYLKISARVCLLPKRTAACSEQMCLHRHMSKAEHQQDAAPLPCLHSLVPKLHYIATISITSLNLSNPHQGQIRQNFHMGRNSHCPALVKFWQRCYPKTLACIISDTFNALARIKTDHLYSAVTQKIHYQPFYKP